MGANVPWAGDILNPSGIIGRIYVKHHITLFHTKYTSFWSCGCREEDCFHMFPVISLWQIMYYDVPGAWPVWTPGAWLSVCIKKIINIATHKI